MCYAGTIAGVVLALCTVGKYLFSENLASFLTFLCNLGNGTTLWPKYIVVVGLLGISNFIIYSQIRKEFRGTKCYRKCCGVKRGYSQLDSSNSDTDRQGS